MKNKSNTDTKIVWTCDFCEKEFETKKESDKHELSCKQNPKNNEIVFRIKKPNSGTVFGWVSFFLFIYFIVYVVANANAQNNGLPIRDLLQPQKWFSSEDKTEIIIPTPTLIREITSTPKPKIQNTPKTENTGSQIDCIGPDGKHFKTTEAECKKFNESWGNKTGNNQTTLNNNQNSTGSNTDSSKVNCSYHNGEYNFDFGMLTASECLNKSDIYWKSKNVPIPTTISQQSPLPTRIIVDYYYCSTTVDTWCSLHTNDPSYNEKCNVDRTQYKCPGGGNPTIAGLVQGLDYIDDNQCVCVR